MANNSTINKELNRIKKETEAALEKAKLDYEKRVKFIEDHLSLAEDFGGFITIHDAAEMLNVSRQRVNFLKSQGRIRECFTNGLSLGDVCDYLVNRKNGRPKKSVDTNQTALSL